MLAEKRWMEMFMRIRWGMNFGKLFEWIIVVVVASAK